MLNGFTKPVSDFLVKIIDSGSISFLVILSYPFFCINILYCKMLPFNLVIKLVDVVVVGKRLILF